MLNVRKGARRAAAESYRKDVGGRDAGDAFGQNDGTWIAIASLLDHASTVGGLESQVLVRDAVKLAETLTWPAGGQASQSSATPASSAEAIDRLAQQLEDAGA